MARGHRRMLIALSYTLKHKIHAVWAGGKTQTVLAWCEWIWAVYICSRKSGYICLSNFRPDLPWIYQIVIITFSISLKINCRTQAIKDNHIRHWSSLSWSWQVQIIGPVGWLLKRTSAKMHLQKKHLCKNVSAKNAPLKTHLQQMHLCKNASAKTHLCINAPIKNCL